MRESPGLRLRKRLREKEILVAPGAHDVLTARIIEMTGFDAVYMTGYGTSASLIGQPDVGLLTQTEMFERAINIVNAVEVPVIADADNGFGNAINVQRTVRLYEKAGVACVQLEDQVSPKKCGHMIGRELITMQEMVGKIHAAVDARENDDLMIMARTDARTEFGIEAAIERGKAYEEAGADLLFIESPETEEEMKAITTSFNVPVLANMIEHGRTPLLSAQKLEDIGYDLVIFCVSSTYAAAKAIQDLMNTLKAEGTTEGFMDRMIPFDKFNKMIGLSDVRAKEEKFNTGRRFVEE
jgi:carboxyvinyl-carboxyphosphonate phosphorylmutase